MKSFNEYLNERLITLGGKRPKFNQIVIMAGGAGSGKGFVQKKLLGIEGKSLDVDAIKELLTGTSNKPEHFAKKYAQRIKDEFNIDVTKLDLRNEMDVSTLHIIEKHFKVADKRTKSIFKSAISSPDRKPNIIFDVTMKEIEKLQKISDQVIELGYKKEDIHIIWVVNELQTAIDQNSERSRRVKSDILMKTHTGVSATISNIVKSGTIQQYADGDFWFVFNKKGIDSFMVKSEYGGSYVKDAIYVKLKEKNKQMISFDDLAKLTVKKMFKGEIQDIDIMDRVKNYVPDASKWTNEGIFMADKGEPAKLMDKFITTFWKQNKWHKHGVFVHTLNVVLSAIKSGDYRMIPAAFLHDVGKPVLATRDDDTDELSYSFKGHEEGSYEIIKNWRFVSKYTKELVRWHYLIRGKSKAREKYQKTGNEDYLKEYERQKKIWDSLDSIMKKELQKFLKHDDNGKDIRDVIKKVK